MIISHIALCGFRGFREEVRIDLSPAFTILCGRNGVGKSTICDAFEFALTGGLSKYEVQRSGKEKIEDYFWWRGENAPSEYWVEVGFRDADRSFTIRRSRHEGVTLAESLLIDALSVKDGRPQDTLTELVRTTLIRDELITRWSLDLTQEDRFQFVKAVLGSSDQTDLLPKASQTKEEADIQAKRLARELEEFRLLLDQQLTKQAELRIQTLSSNSLSKRTIDLFEINPAWPIDRQAEQGRQRLEALRERVSEAQRVIAVVHTAQELRSRVLADDFTAAHRGLEEALQRCSADLTHIDREVERFEDLAEIAKGDQKEWVHFAQLLEHGSTLGLQHDRCPLCDARRSEGEFLESIDRLRNRVSKRAKRASDLISDLASLRAKKSELQAEFDSIQARLAPIRSELARLAALDQQLSKSLQFNLGSDGTEAQDFSAILGSLQESLVEAERAYAEISSLVALEELKVAESKVGQARERLSVVELRHQRLETAVERADLIRRATQSAINELALERLLMIKPLLAELYKRLRPHTEWKELDFRLTGDIRRAFNLVVGDEVNPQFVFSSGQRRAAGLAFLLALHLSCSWSKLKTLILDDPVQHIDDYRAVNLVEVISAIRRSDRQIVVAVEDEELALVLARRLQGVSVEPGTFAKIGNSLSGGGTLLKAETVGLLPQRVLKLAS